MSFSNGIRSQWRRVNRSRRCPVCGHDSWCLVSADNVACICPRTQSTRTAGKAGWLHVLADQQDYTPPPIHRSERITDTGYWAKMQERCESKLSYAERARLAESLGLQERSLLALGIGKYRDTYSFPMRNHRNEITGMRLRGYDGSKRSAAGSMQGIFISRHPFSGRDPILICEGPTDAAAMIGMGFDVIGRPSCQGCEQEAATLVGRRACVVMADVDGPGLEGATKLAHVIRRTSSSVKIVMPPYHKDVRDWVKAGASRVAVLATIGATVEYRS